MNNSPPKSARVHAYARDVVAGRIVAGRYVVAACRRHLADLAATGLDDHARPLPPESFALATSTLYFDSSKAEAHLSFFEDVLHLKADTPFKLDDFQAFIIGSLYGWQRLLPDGTRRRRFRTAYIEIAKANGKTPLAAGIGLDSLVVGDEHAPEVYSAAAAKEQARICFNDAVSMVEASPYLPRIQVLTNCLTGPRRAIFRPLSSEDKGQHGKRVSTVILDELHAHSTPAMARAMIAGTKGRANALIIIITNSGSDTAGICWSYHEQARKTLEGTLVKDDLFAYLTTLDPCPACLDAGKHQPDPKCPRCDDYRNPATWAKANPRLHDPDVRRYVEERVDLARTMPSEANNVLQLNFCLWTASDNGWLNMYAWNNLCRRATLRLAQFAGRSGSVAIDAANKVDITSMAVVFENDADATPLDPATLSDTAQVALRQAMGIDPTTTPRADAESSDAPLSNLPAQLNSSGYSIFWAHFVPAALVANADGPNHALYKQWEAEGTLIVTPGAMTDFGIIMATLAAWRRLFQIRRFSYDPREMTYMVQQMQAQDWCDFEIFEYNQSPALISGPMKTLEALNISGLLHHNGDGPATWMMSNVIQKSAQTGQQTKIYFPARPSEHQKIDAAAAAIMALDGILRAPAPTGVPGVVFL